MLYAKSTGGFYDPEINTNIPADAVEITELDHAALLAAQAVGKIIKADAEGKPVAVTVSLTPDQIRAQYEAAAQDILDSTAQSWGYDSVISAASYASSGVARYKAEADALIAWRDSLWQAAYNVEVSVQNGAAMPATAADFLAMLPPAPTRPTA